MSPYSLSLSAGWTAAGWTMLHLGWIGAVVGIVAALLRRLLRGARPEIRYGVALAALLGLTTAPTPLFLSLLPTGKTPVAPIVLAGGGTSPRGQNAIIKAPPPAVAANQVAQAIAPTPALTPLSARFEPLVGYLPAVWLAGSVATLGLVATGLLGVERLRRSSRPFAAFWIARRCRELADSFGVARRVGVSVCDRIAAPVLVGILRPMIILPAAAVCGWSLDQVEMALLHELAHIRRHDNLVTLLQRLAESLLFFHPAAWWLSAWVSLERELCCDALVVKHTGRPQAYARMLATLAGVAERPPSLALAMAKRPLTTRIRRILEMEDRSMKMTLTEGLGFLASVIAGTVITLAACASPPENGKYVGARRDLNRLADRVIAMPDGVEDYKDAGQAYDGKGLALIEVARADIKLGDRAGALATIRRLDRLAEPAPPRPGAQADPRHGPDSSPSPNRPKFAARRVTSTAPERFSAGLGGSSTSSVMARFEARSNRWARRSMMPSPRIPHVLVWLSTGTSRSS